MPPDAVTPAAGAFGKLPAHGDFVRRGPAALVSAVDRWISGELNRRAAADPDGFDAWLERSAPVRLLVGVPPLAVAVLPSRDAVGRAFPLVAFAPGGAATARAVLAIAETIVAIGEQADMLMVGLKDMEAGGARDDAAEEIVHAAGWPVGPAFDALFAAAVGDREP